MSVYGSFKDATILQGTNITSVIDLGREYDYLSAIIPGMDLCSLRLMVSETEGGTYYDLGSGATTNEETFNRADVWRLGGYRFIKIKSSVAQSASRIIRICGMRY